jgi:antitoxin VapB
MALSIKDPETDRLARELAEATGETITEAIRVAIAERLERARGHRYPPLRAALQRIHERMQALPVLDDRSPDDMLYDEFGLPK